MTYIWTFPNLVVHPSAAGESDVIYNIHWRLYGDDQSGHTAYIAGTVGCTYDAGDPFVPFSDLTKAEVESWTVASLGDERVIELKAQLAEEIGEEVAPTTEVMTPPWRNGE